MDILIDKPKPRLKFAICSLDEDDNVIKVGKAITTNWTTTIIDEIKRDCGVDIKKEMAAIIVKELTMNITPDDIMKLISTDEEVK
jgi:hypothetical protein